MNPTIDIARRRRTYANGRQRDDFYLLASHTTESIVGSRINLGGRRRLLDLRRKIDELLAR